MGSVPPVIRGYGDLVFIGRGGFASVYRARQLAFDRDVALKVIDQGHADARAADQFARECWAIGSLSWHPHVVPVYDAGRTEEGASYLAMELLPGGSLADALEAGPLPVGDAVGYVHDVADALAAAHELDVLHRDVKPANILLDRRGRARLADFGIARMAGTGPTTTGAVTGTIAYLAPEVLAGARASEASDVYALGVTLATLLGGRNPYVQETDDNPFAVLTRVMAGELPTLPVEVPDAVADVVRRCMAREPEDRPPSAAAVQGALADVGPAPAAAPPPPPPPAPPPPAPPPPPPPGAPAPRRGAAGPPTPARRPQRSLRVAAVAAVVVVGLVAAVAVGAALWLRDEPVVRAGTAATTTATSRPSTTTEPDATTTAATTTTAPGAVWDAPGEPSADHRTLLDDADTMFVTAAACRPIDDAEADPHNVYPQGVDEASIECRYGDDATIVFSLFADEARASAFFEERLDSRGLPHGTGTIGPSPPWQLDHAEDPLRGTGSIFGAERTVGGLARSEIGFIRSGLRTYAYSFAVGTDFPTFYRWWSERYAGPAPPG